MVELVLVMVVIGILSAVAMPRLFDFTGQARKTVVIAIGSSLQTSVALAYSQWIASGQPTSILVGTDNFYTGTLGYPINTGTTTKILDAAECLSLWNTLLKNPPLADTTESCAADGTCKFEVTQATTICTFTDKDGNTITYNTATGAASYTLI